VFARYFFQNNRGNVTPIFALAMVPLIGFVGASVDYSRAGSVRAMMQAALDSAALALSKETTGLTSDQLTQKGSQYFFSSFHRPEARDVTVTAALTPSGTGMFTLRLAATGAVDTTFSRAFGQTEMRVGSSAEVVWGLKRIELALALDNTGSMSSKSKMVELKKAAKSLVNTLKTAAKKPEDVKIAIIPFDTTVNLGTAYKEETWLNFNTIGSYNWNSSSGNYVWNPGNKNTWEGCLTDRDQNYDVQDTPPTTGNPSTMFPAADCGSLAKMLPLTNDWTALTNKIDAMTPNGNTNVTIGLVWAWHALTAGVPLTEASAPQADLDKVLILLTDGDNTQNRWSSTSSQIDARTSKACTNIKAAGIKVYTVRVIDGNASLLKDCATNPGMFYDVKQADQLSGVFSSIAQNLANLRIAK
jgi:Flp pilus assembly protein TadG